jgi:hypothetical protein
MSLLGYAENSSSSPGFGYIPIGTALAVGPEIRTHSSIEQRDQLDQEEDMCSTPHGPFINRRGFLDCVTLAGAATLAPQVVQAQVAGSVPPVRLAQTGTSPSSRTCDAPVDHLLVDPTGILESLSAAEPRLGLRTARTFPLLPPPQKN